MTSVIFDVNLNCDDAERASAAGGDYVQIMGIIRPKLARKCNNLSKTKKSQGRNENRKKWKDDFKTKK